MKIWDADRVVHVDSYCCGWCHDELVDEDAVNDGVDIVCFGCWFAHGESDAEAAEISLADFDKNGGPTLNAVKSELDLQRTPDNDDDTLHTYPLNDARAHIKDGSPCWCGATANEEGVVVHMPEAAVSDFSPE